MKALPSLIIVADRGHLAVYQSLSTGALRAMESTDITEGREKLSDQLTDNAGRFPSSNTAGQGNSSAERLPLLAELERRALKKIAEWIKELCAKYQPDTWGFAAPETINRAILDCVDEQWHENLVINLKLDLAHVPAQQVAQHFAKAKRQPQPVF